MDYRVRHLTEHGVDLILEMEVTSARSLVIDTLEAEVWGQA